MPTKPSADTTTSDMADSPNAGAATHGKIGNATRLVNLLFYLESHPHGATSQQIRDEVPGYRADRPSCHQQGRDAKQSAEAFNRKFRRDRKSLEGMGFPIIKSGNTQPVYSLDLSKRSSQNISLEQKDVELLKICTRNALEDPDFLMRSELVSAMEKVRLCFGENEFADAACISAGTQAISAASIAQATEDAAEQQAALRFEYRTASGALGERTVVPLKVFRYLGDNYLMAYDAARADRRTFRFDRILTQPQLTSCNSELLQAALVHADEDPVVLPFQIGDGRLMGRAYFSEKVSRSQRKVDSLTQGKGSLDPHGRGLVWTVEVADPLRFAQWTVEKGPGILAIDPPEAAEAVSRGLEALANG